MKENEKELQKASNHSGTQAKCALYCYNQLEISEKDENGKRKFLTSNKNGS